MDILRRLSYWGVLALLIYMPLHIFLSQSLSLLTGGLDYWKLGKDALLFLMSLFIICMVWRKHAGGRPFGVLLILTAGYVAVHLLLWAAHPAIFRDSALLGVIYNVRVFLFLLVGMGAGLIVKQYRSLNLRLVYKVVLGISTLVVVLGV